MATTIPGARYPAPDECEECEEEVFLNTYCPECDQWMCNDCDKVIHKKGKRARHVRKYRQQIISSGRASINMPMSAPNPSDFGSAYENEDNDDKEDKEDKEDKDDNDDKEESKADEVDPTSGTPPSTTVFGSSPATRPPPPLGAVPPPPPSAQQPTSAPSSPSSTVSGLPRSDSSLPSSNPSFSGLPSFQKEAAPVMLFNGLLKKKKKKGIRVWQLRFFKLMTNELLYYKAKDAKEAAGTILLSDVKEVVEVPGDKSGTRFDVVAQSQGRTFELQSSTREECKAWVLQISNALIATKRRPTIQSSFSSPAPIERSVSTIDVSPVLLPQPSTFSPAVSRHDDDEDEVDDPSNVELPVKVTTEYKAYPIGIGEVFNAADPEAKDSNVWIHMIKKNDANFAVAEKFLGEIGKTDHPFIFPQLHYGYSSDAVFGVYLPPGESLAHHLDVHRKFPEPVVRLLGAQLLQVLEHIHDKQGVFSTLAPDRIFLDAEDGHLVVGDFLLFCDPTKIPEECETPEYVAPDAKYSRVTDFWRFGVLLYEMAVGVPPIRAFGEDKKTALAAARAQFTVDALEFPSYISQDFRNLIKDLLKPATARLGRQGVEAVKQHEFFANGNLAWYNLVNHTLPWFNEHVVDANLTTSLKPYAQTSVARYKHMLTIELMGARQLPLELEKSCICQISCESQTQTSDLVKETDSPTWNSLYNFQLADIDSSESILSIDLLPDAKSKEVIASTQFQLPHIASLLNQAGSNGVLELWSTLLLSSGFPSQGEIHVTFRLISERINIPPKKITPITIPFRQTFSGYFGKAHAPEEKKPHQPPSQPKFTPPPISIPPPASQHAPSAPGTAEKPPQPASPRTMAPVAFALPPINKPSSSPTLPSVPAMPFIPPMPSNAAGSSSSSPQLPPLNPSQLPPLNPLPASQLPPLTPASAAVAGGFKFPPPPPTGPVPLPTASPFAQIGVASPFANPAVPAGPGRLTMVPPPPPPGYGGVPLPSNLPPMPSGPVPLPAGVGARPGAPSVFAPPPLPAGIGQPPVGGIRPIGGIQLPMSMPSKLPPPPPPPK